MAFLLCNAVQCCFCAAAETIPHSVQFIYIDYRQWSIEECTFLFLLLCRFYLSDVEMFPFVKIFLPENLLHLFYSDLM